MSMRVIKVGDGRGYYTLMSHDAGDETLMETPLKRQADGKSKNHES